MNRPSLKTTCRRLTRLLAEAIGSSATTSVVAFALSGNAERPPAPRIQLFGLARLVSDGRWLIFTPRPNVIARTIPRIVTILVLSLLALPLVLLSVWAGAWFAAPVARLSAATNAFARDIQAPGLAEPGALEVRRAIAVFNDMQHGLRRRIDDRTKTLAFVGHDMRTPLTRLRLRLEAFNLGNTRAPVERDLSVLETIKGRASPTNLSHSWSNSLTGCRPWQRATRATSPGLASILPSQVT